MPVSILDIILILLLVRDIESKAMMIEPPHRSSLWRYDQSSPVNTKDDMLNCGGYEVQWEQNSGLCDVCGQPYKGLLVDGKAYQIVRSYMQGAYVNVTIEVMSNLLGFFEFRLCPRNSSSEILAPECFESNMLWIEESWSTRYYVGSHGGVYDLHVRLPADISCSNCVFQWKYSTGYRMGGINECQCMGCGRQETFYNCADIEILPEQFIPDRNFVSTEINIHEPIFLISEKNLTDSTIEQFRSSLPIFNRPKPTEIQKPKRGYNKRLQILNSRLVALGIGKNAHKKIVDSMPDPKIKGTSIPKWSTDNSHIKFRANITFPIRNNVVNFWDQFRRVSKQSTWNVPTHSPKSPSFWNNLLPTGTARSYQQPKTGVLVKTFHDSHERNYQYYKRQKSGDSIIYPLFSVPSTSQPVSSKNGDCYPHSQKYRCKGKGPYSHTRGMDEWCLRNCRSNNCVHFMCECGCDDNIVNETKCHAIGPYEDIYGMDEWCSQTCSRKSCPTNVCSIKDCQNGS